MKIVGIGGLSRSGKDSLAELLIQAGFYGFSLGDFMRNHSRKRHQDKPDPISVANITETANWLRSQHGADVALEAALKEFEEKKANSESYKGLVLYSVRAPIEADFILNHNGELIWVESSDEVRYQRMLNNMREGETRISLEEFVRQENLQAEPQPDVPVEAQMNAPYIKSKATKTLINNGNDFEAFKTEAKKILKDYLED